MARYLKSFTQSFILNLTLWSFLWLRLSLIENKHFAVQENFWVKASVESCLVLIRLKQAPAHAHSWAHFKAQQHHVGSLSPFLGHHLQKFAICWYPSTWSLLFQPNGLYSASWGLDLSPCVRLFTFPLLCTMSSESKGWLAYVSYGKTHWPRPEQLIGWIAASIV